MTQAQGRRGRRVWDPRDQASWTRQSGVCFWDHRGLTLVFPAHLPSLPRGAARGPRHVQRPHGTSAVQGLQKLLEWKKPDSQLIRPDLRNTITSFKTKQLPARAFLPEPPEQPARGAIIPKRHERQRVCRRRHASAHVCMRVCVRGLGGNDVCALLPPAPRELWPPHQGREVGLRPLRDPAGSSLGWICGAQSHDPPRAPPPFPVWENARGSPDGCPGGALLCGQPWVMGDVGHLDVQPGALLAELQPPGTLALPAFSKPPGEERRGVVAPGCSGAGVRRALPAEWGPVLPPRVCLSLWLLGTGQLAWGGGREVGSLACQPGTFLHAGVQASPPGSQVRSRVCKGPLSRTRLAWRPHPAPVPGDLPHGHSGVRRPFTKPPYTACPFCLPSRGVWRTPYGLPPWTGVSLSKRVSPVTWHHPLWGPCVLTVCVGGPRGDSWGVKQPGPGCPLLGGGYWERCFPRASMGPGEQAGVGLPLSSAPTDPVPQDPEHPSPPVPLFLSQKAGGVSSGGPQGLVPGQQAQMVLGAVGPGSGDLIRPPTGPGPTAGQLPGSSLQPPTSPQGTTFQDWPFLACSPRLPAPGTRGGASFTYHPPAPRPTLPDASSPSAWSRGGDHMRGKWARHLPPTLSQGHLGPVVRPRQAGPYPPSRPAGRLPRPWLPAQKEARRAALPRMPGTQTLCLDLWAGFPGGPTAVTTGQRLEDPFCPEGRRAVFHPGASLRRHLPESRGTRTGVQGSRSSTRPVTASCPGSLQPGSPPGTQ